MKNGKNNLLCNRQEMNENIVFLNIFVHKLRPSTIFIFGFVLIRKTKYPVEIDGQNTILSIFAITLKQFY